MPQHQHFILVVDDDSDFRKIVRKILEGAGYRVGEAASATEGLAALKQQKPHLLLCDLSMPEIDGFALLTVIRQTPEYESIPVVVLSRLNKKQFVHRAAALGAAEYVLKPLQAHLFLQKLRKVLRQSEFRRRTFPRAEEPTLRGVLPCRVLGLNEHEVEISASIRLSPQRTVHLENAGIRGIGISAAQPYQVSARSPVPDSEGSLQSRLSWLALPEPLIQKIRRLPAPPRRARAAAGAPETAGARPLLGLVDSDLAWVREMTKELEKRGYDTVAASDPADLIPQATGRKLTAVAVDLRLLGTTEARAWMAELRAQGNAHLPILMVTTATERRMIAHALELGASDYLLKPLDVERFLGRVRILVNAGPHAQELPLAPLAADHQDGSLDLDWRVESIDELGATLRGFHLPFKGTELRLRGPLIDDLFGPGETQTLVIESTEMADDGYLSRGEWLSLSPQATDRLRTWLA
jgi:DNA-binding response OmpR family regulator